LITTTTIPPTEYVLIYSQSNLKKAAQVIKRGVRYSLTVNHRFEKRPQFISVSCHTLIKLVLINKPHVPEETDICKRKKAT